MVTVNGVEVASTPPQPTHISIHIHQESVLAQLLKAGCSLKGLFARWRDPGPRKTGMSYGLLAGGVRWAGEVGEQADGGQSLSSFSRVQKRKVD